MALFALLISIIKEPTLPAAQVESLSSEIEGIYVPAGFEGPIVAAPFTAIVF